MIKISWTAPKINWATEDNISTTLLNDIGNNLRYLKGLDGTVTIESNIAFPGVQTVDGVDISSFKSTYDSHAANVNAHIDDLIDIPTRHHHDNQGLGDWDHTIHPSIYGYSARTGQTFDQSINLKVVAKTVYFTGGASPHDVPVTWPAFSKTPVVVPGVSTGYAGRYCNSYNESVSGCIVRVVSGGGEATGDGYVNIVAIGPV